MRRLTHFRATPVFASVTSETSQAKSKLAAPTDVAARRGVGVGCQRSDGTSQERKKRRKVQHVKTVGKPGEAMSDGREWRRILADLKLQQSEQKQRKDKPQLKNAKKGIPLPITRNSETYAGKDGKKTQHAECNRS